MAITEPANEMYGKVMSIPDNVMENYFELATDVPMDEVRALIKSDMNPRDIKRRLAREIVALYHGAKAAEEADDYFVRTFSQRQQPAEAQEVKLRVRARSLGWNRSADFPVLVVPYDLRMSLDAGLVDRRGVR